MNTTVNKANMATLIAVLAPMITWAVLRGMAGWNLSEAETAMFTAGIGGVLAWVGVYFTPNAAPPVDAQPQPKPIAFHLWPLLALCLLAAGCTVEGAYNSEPLNTTGAPCRVRVEGAAVEIDAMSVRCTGTKPTSAVPIVQ